MPSRKWTLVSGYQPRALNLGRHDADAVALVQNLVRAGRLAIDADEVVLGLRAGQALSEEAGNVGAVRDLDVVRETAAVVVDEENAQVLLLEIVGKIFDTEQTEYKGEPRLHNGS